MLQIAVPVTLWGLIIGLFSILMELKTFSVLATHQGRFHKLAIYIHLHVVLVLLSSHFHCYFHCYLIQFWSHLPHYSHFFRHTPPWPWWWWLCLLFCIWPSNQKLVFGALFHFTSFVKQIFKVVLTFNVNIKALIQLLYEHRNIDLKMTSVLANSVACFGCLLSGSKATRNQFPQRHLDICHELTLSMFPRKWLRNIRIQMTLADH